MPMADGRRERGDRTRETVLAPALRLATVKGLEGFSLGDVAEASGVSKAGIATLFGGKQELQTAIAARARQVLEQRVFRPVFAQPPGLARLEKLGPAWLRYLADPKLKGGCFFAAAFFELDSQPGPLRDMVRDDMRRWIKGIEVMIEDGQSAGEIVSTVDAADEAFDFFSTGVVANAMIQLGVVARPAEQALRVWNRHVDRLRAAP